MLQIYLSPSPAAVNQKVVKTSSCRMSQSSAVYQPTTVTYEASNGPGDRWQDRPISYLASSVTQAARRPCGGTCMPSRHLYPVILITSSVACFSLGLVMLIRGAMGYSDTPEDKEGVYLTVTIFGAVFFALSILLFVFFMRMTRRICWRNAKDHLNASGGQALTVNPSTDFLVSAQYAPVSEVAYQPTPEDTEQSKLMPQENKELIDDGGIVESDPRIVLRPLNSSAVHSEEA